MADDTDQDLIRAYARSRCEGSFGQLVHRHVDLVHSTALRIVRDSSLAQDVTQRVFLALAQHSATLQRRSSLTGWLHETARNIAINTVRGEERRRQREQEAASMSNLPSCETDTLWRQIAPHLDEAIAQLNSVDRDVILWRYFERRTAEQIGQRLGVTSEAAQKRATRALERLRGLLANRGLAAPSVLLATMLSTHAVQSAPVGLAATAIAGASAASAILPATSTLQIIMASTKAKIGLAAVLAASVTTPLVLQYQTNTLLRGQIAQLRTEASAPPAQAVPPDTSGPQRLQDEHEELLRLRAQVAQLRQQLTNQPKVPGNITSKDQKKSADRLDFEVENARKLLARFPEIPMIPTASFTNAGYATPLASFHTINWAAVNRDTNAMFNAIGLEPEARTRAEELFAQMPEAVRQKYRSVDALLVDWRMNLSDAPEGYRVLAQREQGPDAAALTVQFQYPNGRVRENDLSLYRDQDGVWRFAIPPQVMEKLPHVISGQTPSTGTAK